MEGPVRVRDPAFIDPSEIPSYLDCIQRIYGGMKFYIDHNTNYDQYPYSLKGFWREVTDFGEVTLFDITVTIAVAVGWTLARYFLTWAIFAPFSRSLKMKESDTKKMPESMWKVIIYCVFWGMSCYVLFGSPQEQHKIMFSEPIAIWKDWMPGMDVGRLVYTIYVCQMAFYMHSVYGTLFMDEWRKDSAVMIFHHFLTMFLIGFSYIIRYHKIGVLVLFVHDVTDILLEFTKCNVYLKNRNGKYYPFHDHLSTVGFASFSVAWFVFRLYWFPLKVLYSAAYGCMIFVPMGADSPCYLFFNVMLLILQGLNIWWFNFILVFLYKVLTGQITEMEDVREADVDAKLRKETQSATNGGGDFTPRRSVRNKDKKRD